MRRLGPGRLATLATLVSLATIAGALFAVNPAAAGAWIASSALITWQQAHYS